MLRSKFVSLFILLFIILINSINSFSQSEINSFKIKQQNQVRFTSTIPISGISFNSIAEDSLGFYWIGTNNGLTRYDGKNFKFFSSLQSDSGKILIYQCKVFKDATGRIWINSNNKLYYFNLHCFKLKYFPNPVLVKWSINALVSTDQFIWIANNLPPYSLSRLDMQTGTYKNYKVSDSLFIKGNRIFGMINYNETQLWMVGDLGVLVFDKTREKYVDLIGDKLKNKAPLQYYGFFSIYKSNFGGVFVLTWVFNNIYYYSIKDSCFYNSKSKDEVAFGNSCFLDKNENELWFSKSNKLYSYNKKTFETVAYNNNLDNNFSFPKDVDEIEAAIKDSRGNFIFLCSNCIVKSEAINQTVTTFNYFSVIKSSPEIKDFAFHPSIAKIDSGRYLMATWGKAGSVILDEKNNKLIALNIYTDDLKNNFGLIKLKQDHEGNIWAINSNEIFKFDRVSNHFEIVYSFLPKITNEIYYGKDFTDLLLDNDGNLWISSFRNGVFFFNTRNFQLQHFPRTVYHPEQNMAQAEYMNVDFDDGNGNIWATSKYFSYIINKKTKKFNRLKRNAEGYDYMHLFQDSKKNIWITTSSMGLQLWNNNKRKFENYKTNIDLNGYQLSNMVQDRLGFLWIESENELFRLNAETGSLLRCNYDLKLKTGIEIMGFKNDSILVTTNGSTLFDMNVYAINRLLKAPTVVFSGLKILGDEITFTSDINYLEELKLPYEKNYITLEFAAPKATSPSSVHFVYRLIGLKEDWIGAIDNNISLANLSPGRYLLELKGINAAGIESEFSKKLKIIITPPWWKTFWFLLIVIFAACGLVYLIYRYRINEILKLHNIRNSIARDLHDDVGSSLSSIKILTEVGESGTSSNFETLRKIKISASRSLENMSDIVWSVNPANDSLEHILSRMNEYAVAILEPLDIKFKIDADENTDKINLSMDKRRDFYLIFKEAVNNVAKYSGCTEAVIQISLTGHKLIMTIRDNGNGFNTHQVSNGNGLKNMKARADKLKGILDINSEQGKGTTVMIEMHITNFSN